MSRRYLESDIIKAALFAGQCHEGQTRKWTGRPYIEHPMRVAGRAALLVSDDGLFECDVIAAWLHDTLEDCEITVSDIDHRFGMHVAGIVLGLTNPSRGSKEPRAVRKAMDRAHLARQPKSVKALKLLDRIDNVRDLQVEGPGADFQSIYMQESFDLIDALVLEDPLIESLCSELREELQRLHACIVPQRLK